jgi:hypothetical protein
LVKWCELCGSNHAYHWPLSLDVIGVTLLNQISGLLVIAEQRRKSIRYFIPHPPDDRYFAL